MAAKAKLEFFNDIKSQVFLVLGGIVSLATVIPLFLNSTSQLFGLNHISYGYYLFVFIYFIVPYLFYLFYCSIHDDVGYLELLPDKVLVKLKKHKRLKQGLETLIPVLAFLYLIFPYSPTSFGVSIVIYAASLFCFYYYTTLYYKEKALFKEFLIICTVIIVVFGVFFFNLIQKDVLYSRTRQKQAFEAYSFHDMLQKQFTGVIDSAGQLSYKYRMQAASLKLGLEAQPPDTDSCKNCHIDSIYRVVNLVDRTDSLNGIKLEKLLKGFGKDIHYTLHFDSLGVDSNKRLSDAGKIWQSFSYLRDYCLLIQKEKVVPVDSQWASLLKDLQFKSMIWFQFLILLGLCLWLKMQVRLGELRGRPSPRQEEKVLDNLGQVKTMILLLFVLIVPWFRPIESSNIDLEKPFMSISLGRLIGCDGSCRPDSESGGGHAPVVADTPQKSGPPEKAQPPCVPITSSVAIVSSDPLILDIDSIVRKNQKLIREQAQRTIGNPADREYFNEKGGK